jgi:uncharacterized protein YhaN
MNTLAEVIEYHQMCVHNERLMLEHAIERRLPRSLKGAQEGIERHTRAVATLQRAVADIERLRTLLESAK